MSGRDVEVWALIVACAGGYGAVVSEHDVCAACAEAVRASDVALSIDGADGREPVVATGQLGEWLEDLQLTLGEGPCVDAVTSGGPVLAADLSSYSSRRRWPGFASEAANVGAGAMFAFPLQAGAVRLGVLALHRTRVGALTSDEIADALVFADAALALLLDTKLLGTMGGAGPDGLARLSGGPGERRAEVHQATGMVSVQLQVGMDEALVRLRAYAFAHDRRIADVAHEVIARRLRFVAESEGTGHS